MNAYAIGIDVGGTNTDAALVRTDGLLIGGLKHKTSKNIHDGIFRLVKDLLTQHAVMPKDIVSISIGTTHALNAILEAQGLHPVGLIRIASNNPLLKPCAGWNPKLKDAVLFDYITIRGGFECDGSPIESIDLEEARHAVDHLLQRGCSSFALSSPFSCITSKHEDIVHDLIRSMTRNDPSIVITSSSHLGGVGFIERENGALLNSALSGVVREAFSSVATSLQSLGISCPCLMVTNDGSAHPLDYVASFPILTLSAGQTNSARGGALLYSSAADRSLLVIDIGGTSSDLIAVHNGYVRRHTGEVMIQGARLQFSAPRVISIALGGGTVIQGDREAYSIGPKSIAQRLTDDAISFGGDTLTLTDCAYAMNYISLPHTNICRAQAMDKQLADLIMQDAGKMLIDAISLAKGRTQSLPVALVGGGAPLLFQELQSRIDGLLPLCENYSIANAIGAAFSERIGTIDTIVSLHDRERALNAVSEKAIALAIEKGASQEKVSLKDLQITPLGYSQEKLARVVATAGGPSQLFV